MYGRETTLAAPTTEINEEDILLAPSFLVRIAGLPFNVLDQLRFPHAVALVEEILSIETWLDGRREQLLTRVSEYSQQCTDRSLQHKCLDLRRAMLQAKGQKARKLLQAIAAHLPDELAAELGTWCNNATRRADLIASGEATIQAELTGCRQSLRLVFRHENLQRGLLLSSPTLYTELQHYLTTPASLSNNRARRVEDGLLSYLIRMITKPSPYSTFASTSPGSWREHDTQAARLDIQDWHQKSVVRFHVGLLNSMTCALAKRPEIRPYLRPTLNATMRWLPSSLPHHEMAPASQREMTADRIECLMVEKLGLRQHRYHEGLIRLRLNALKRAIVEIIEHRGATLTYQELIEMLAGSPAARELSTVEGLQDGRARAEENAGRVTEIYTAEEIIAALEYLADRTALNITLSVPEHEDDKLTYIINQLTAIPGAWVAKIQSMFQDLHALLETYASAAAAQRYDLLLAIRQQTHAICDEIGSHPASPIDMSREIDKIFPNLILEDTTYTAQELTLNRTTWQPLLKDLCVLQQIAPLLEGSQIWQLIADCLVGAVVAVPGTLQDDVLHYHLQLNRAYNSPPASEQQLQVLRPQLAQYKDARQAFATMIAEQVQQARECGSSKLELNPRDIQAFAQRLPAFLRRRYALAYFGQLFSEDGRHQMVVNLAWPGPGTIFSRFSYLPGNSRSMSASHSLHTPDVENFSTAVSFIDSVRGYVAELGRRHGVIYASIAETGGFNVNIHAPLTPYEILFPKSVSLHPPEEQLRLRDLRMFRDPETLKLQLVSRRLGAQISPIHMGFSVANVLPPLYQTLVTPNSHYPGFNPVVLIEARLQPEQKQQSRYYPRITLGHAVLSRETWKIPQSYLPRREAGETTFDYFLKVNRWRIAQGLPQEGFWRILSRAEQRIIAQDEYVARLLEGNQTVPAAQKNIPASDLTVTHTGAPGQANTITGSNGIDWRETPDLHALFNDDALRKPFYVNFHNCLLLPLFNAAIQATPEGQTLTFEEMLPARNHSLLHHDSEDYATEFVVELSQ